MMEGIIQRKHIMAEQANNYAGDWLGLGAGRLAAYPSDSESSARAWPHGACSLPVPTASRTQ